MVHVIPRSEWGARHENGDVVNGRPVILRLPFSEWWLHHSVTIAPDLVPPFDDEHRAMRTLEDIGEQRFGRGISYTWPIMPTGNVYEGHSVDRRGAHTGGRNDIARAICFVGNYEVTEPTPRQIESAAQLMVQEYRAGRAKTYRLNGGHRDLKSTSCPGKYAYRAISVINARATALINGAPAVELAPRHQQEDDTMLIECDYKKDANGKVTDHRFGIWSGGILIGLAGSERKGFDQQVTAGATVMWVNPSTWDLMDRRGRMLVGEVVSPAQEQVIAAAGRPSPSA